MNIPKMCKLRCKTGFRLLRYGKINLPKGEKCLHGGCSDYFRDVPNNRVSSGTWKPNQTQPHRGQI